MNATVVSYAIYLALALPLTVRNHLHNPRGTFQVEVVPGAPVNAETDIALDERHGACRARVIGPLHGHQSDDDLSQSRPRLLPDQ